MQEMVSQSYIFSLAILLILSTKLKLQGADKVHFESLNAPRSSKWLCRVSKNFVSARGGGVVSSQLKVPPYPSPLCPTHTLAPNIWSLPTPFVPAQSAEALRLLPKERKRPRSGQNTLDYQSGVVGSSSCSASL